MLSGAKKWYFKILVVAFLWYISDFQVALRFSPWPHCVYSSLKKSFKDVLSTGATGLWMSLTAESFDLSPPLETGHRGWGEEAAPQWILSRPALFSGRVQADKGGWPPLCSNQLPAQVKSKSGALLWTTALAEWLGLITLKSGFQPSPTILGPRILRVLPRLCDHAKSADRK